jgi:hypothetical protein
VEEVEVVTVVVVDVWLVVVELLVLVQANPHIIGQLVAAKSAVALSSVESEAAIQSLF